MKARAQDRFNEIFCGVVATLVFSSMLLSVEAQGATYYLSPTGSDSDFGNSSASPWKTFNFAIPKLSPGDTLILANGTYNASNSGHPSIRCGAHDTNAKNGTVAQPITVRAANERQAFLQGSGTHDVLFIWLCAYWTFEGLRLESADTLNGQTQGMPVHALDSNNLIFRRLLLHKNNRYQNGSLLLLNRTNYSLIEESEFYAFHRHGLSIIGNNNTVRRNYVNSRNHSDINGGKSSSPSHMGDGGITIYPGSNNIIENNIIENTGQAVDIEAIGQTTNNKFFGNISLRNDFGALFHARGNTLAQMPRDTYLENHVSLNSNLAGGYFRGTKNTRCMNCTSLVAGVAGFGADENQREQSGDGKSTVFYKNTLANNNVLYGLVAVGQSDFGVDHSNAFSQTLDFSPSNHSRYTNISRLPPGLGSCKVFIPETSPMKGAGANGADIGANVLYRYQNGALTSTPLWNGNTGAFTCGAQVVGVNNIPGSSCFDIHQRLNVNTNGCFLPVGYGNETSSARVQIGGNRPTITNPAPGSMLTTSTATFHWSVGTGNFEYWVYIGTTQGANNIYDSGRLAGTTTSNTANGLPTNGSTLHVRLWWKASSEWLFADSTY